MRTASFGLAAALLLSAATAARADDLPMANIQFLGGLKALENDWEPADDQRAWGLQFDVMPEDWPLNIAAGFILGESPSEETSIAGIGTVTSESTTAELDVGVRKYVETGGDLRPFLGLGLAIVRGELETTTPVGSDSDSGTGLGFWAGVGMLYMVSEWFGIGGQIQYTQADVEIFGQDLNGGGVHADALVGFSF